MVFYYQHSPAGRLRVQLERGLVQGPDGEWVQDPDVDPLPAELRGGVPRRVQRHARTDHQHLIAFRLTHHFCNAYLLINVIVQFIALSYFLYWKYNGGSTTYTELGEM